MRKLLSNLAIVITCIAVGAVTGYILLYQVGFDFSLFIGGLMGFFWGIYVIVKYQVEDEKK